MITWNIELIECIQSIIYENRDSIISRNNAFRYLIEIRLLMPKINYKSIVDIGMLKIFDIITANSKKNDNCTFFNILEYLH